MHLISNDEDLEISSQEMFKKRARALSVTRAIADQLDRSPDDRLVKWCLAVGFPLGIHVIGLAIALATDWEWSYLRDPVPLVFGLLTLLFVEAVWMFDREFAEMVCQIEAAFDEPPDRFYGFFGELMERLYEPRLTGWTVLLHVTQLLYVIIICFPIILAVTGVGNPPANRPFPNIVFFWVLTGIGVLQVVLLLWVILVIFEFMTFFVQELDVVINPLRRRENLGIQPYGSFIISITSRIFLALAVGGFGIITTPSPFGVVLFVTGLVALLAWFLGTQYGLHRSIIRGKDEYRKHLER